MAFGLSLKFLKRTRLRFFHQPRVAVVALLSRNGESVSVKSLLRPYHDEQHFEPLSRLQGMRFIGGHDNHFALFHLKRLA